MCYFDSVPKIRDVQIPRSKAIRAWKGFNKWSVLVSPHRKTKWRPGIPNKATAHGFYAVVKRPRPHTEAGGYGRYIKRVLLWGRVREYKGHGGFLGPYLHGYRAQYCMIPAAKKRATKKGK